MTTMCLAETGFDWLAIAVLGCAAVVAGVLLLAFARRADRASTAVTALAILTLITAAVIVGPAAPASAASACPPASAPPAAAPVPPAEPEPPAVAGASIGDTAWIDGNRNGLRDPGELPAAGLSVTLISAADGAPVIVGAGGAAVVPTVRTDDAGRFLFAGLLPGSYRVVLDPLESAPAELISVQLADPPDLATGGSAALVRLSVFDSTGAPVLVDAEPGQLFNCSIGFDLVAPGTGHSYSLDYRGTDVTNAPWLTSSLTTTSTSGVLVTPDSGDDTLDSDLDPVTRSTSPLVVVAGQDLLTVGIGIDPAARELVTAC